MCTGLVCSKMRQDDNGYAFDRKKCLIELNNIFLPHKGIFKYRTEHFNLTLAFNVLSLLKVRQKDTFSDFVTGKVSIKLLLQFEEQFCTVQFWKKSNKQVKDCRKFYKQL